MLIVTLVVLVQPLAAVAVTEYVPLVLTTILGVVSPVFQRTPVPDVLAVSVREGAAQVSVPEVGAMLTVGGAVLLITEAD